MTDDKLKTREVIFNLFGRVGLGGEHDGPRITLSSIAEKMIGIVAENRRNDILLKPILLISSRGGSTEEAISIYSYLAHLPIQVTTVAVGLVESAATYIYLAGRHRVATSSSMFVFHESRIQSSSRSGDIIAMAKAEVKKDKLLIDIVARAIDDHKLAARWHRNTFALTAKEAKEAGVVHEINDVMFSGDMIEHPDHVY